MSPKVVRTTQVYLTKLDPRLLRRRPTELLAVPFLDWLFITYQANREKKLLIHVEKSFSKTANPFSDFEEIRLREKRVTKKSGFFLWLDVHTQPTFYTLELY